MKPQLLLAAATVALMAAPTAAFADDPGIYVRGNIGYGTFDDIDIEGDIIGEVEAEGNGTASLGFGYDFGNNWRLELDGQSMFNDLGSIDNVDGSFAKLRATTGMINALYDFNDFGAFQPYLGAGIGIIRGETTTVANDFLNSAGQAVDSPILPAGIGAGFQDGDTGLAWQLIGGLGYAISDNLTWDTQYRYLSSNDLDFDGQIASAPGSLANSEITYEDVAMHSLMTGFRYKFGAATPPPPPPPPAPVEFVCDDGTVVEFASQCPPPPPVMETCWDGSQVTDLALCPPQPNVVCPDGSVVLDIEMCPRLSPEPIADLCAGSRQEIIYYEFDRGQSPETRATINRLLDIGDFCDVGSIRVVGHTDTSGAASYNLALSRRRAADARSELVRQGIDPNIITSEGKGETEPFVETGDGVKEQLNRRTEVLVNLNSSGAVVN